MRELIYNTWNSVMDSSINPLSNIPDLETRHMVMQVLAWMWCIIFSMWCSSITVFGISTLAHTLLIAGIAITVGTFKLAENRPTFFIRKDGHHSTSRSRQNMWVNGKRLYLTQMMLVENTNNSFDLGGEIGSTGEDRCE